MSDDETDEPQPVFPHSGPGKEEMIAEYLPGDDEWEAKTILDINDPAAVAALSNFDSMFPEVEDLQPLIDGFLEQFMKSRTSVEGESRKDFRDMFISMFGGNPGDGEGKSGAIKLVAADDDD